MVTAMPMTPVKSSRYAAQRWRPVSATNAPVNVSANEITCHLIECGRNANGCTSVRYTDGKAAVPQTPALIRVPHSDRTKGSGL
jgi:hypothetical protein